MLEELVANLLCIPLNLLEAWTIYLAGFLYVNLTLLFCRVSALKGSKGKDCEIPVPVGVSVTDENGKIIGECTIASYIVDDDAVLCLVVSSSLQPHRL